MDHYKILEKTFHFLYVLGNGNKYKVSIDDMFKRGECIVINFSIKYHTKTKGEIKRYHELLIIRKFMTIEMNIDIFISGACYDNFYMYQKSFK